MSSFDLSLITGFETIGLDATASNAGGLSVSAHASANTKGSWLELVAASAAEASWIDVIIGSAGTATRWLVDIGIGASGAETVLLPNLHMENANTINSAAHYRFPVAIPAGTRIAARAQSAAGGGSNRVNVILSHGDPGSLTAPGEVIAYGANTGDSGLTAVDPGGTAGTDSAWVQLTAATAEDARWLMLGFGHDATASSNARWLVDVATGGAGAESAILENLQILCGGAGDSPEPRTFGIPVDIPAGTRLAVRARCNTTTTPTRLLDVAVYLADAAVPSGGGGGASAHASASWAG